MSEQAGIPFVMTADMERRLAGFGYTQAEIYNMKPDRAWEILKGKAGDLGAFLAHLHRGGAWAYWWAIDGNHEKQSYWWPVGQPAALPNGRANVYFGVHPTRQKRSANERSTNATIAAVNCLFSEFDAKDYGSLDATLAHVIELDPIPSVVIASGGGYHAYWLLADPFPILSDGDRERARRLQAEWVTLTGGDNAAKDLARVLRVPGTLNYKYTPPRPAAFVNADLARVYDLAELEARIPAATAPAATKPAMPIAATDAYIQAVLDGELSKLAGKTEGERNKGLYHAALKLGSRVGAGLLARDKAEAELTAAGQKLGLTDKEIQATIKSGLDNGEKNPKPMATGADTTLLPTFDPQPSTTAPAIVTSPLPHGGGAFSDLWNAEQLVSRHGQDLRWCDPWQRWLVWDGRRWAPDEIREAERRAAETVRQLYRAAGDLGEPKQREALAGWAIKCESGQRRREMLASARSLLPIRPAELDADPWLLTVTNGTLDLRTGQLHPHRREDLITKLAPVAYDPAAAAPTWAAFLQRIMDRNEGLISFLQRLAGYSLTGDTREQIIAILHGPGQNGKSTLLETLAALMGDYAQQTPAETLLIQRGGGIRDDVADLKGARLVTAIEAEEGRYMAESMVKQLTGGDRVKARHLYGRLFEFRATFKIWLGTNHKPVIRGTDLAIWRRIRLVPFSVTIPEAERDLTLGDKLRGELPGILAWAVAGCLAWQRDGLVTPKEVTGATSAYHDEMDILARWLDDCCLQGPSLQAMGGQLYESYTDWCKRNGEKAESGAWFGKQLGERGFTKQRIMGGNQYQGLGLLMPEPGKAPPK